MKEKRKTEKKIAAQFLGKFICEASPHNWIEVLVESKKKKNKEKQI